MGETRWAIGGINHSGRASSLLSVGSGRAWIVSSIAVNREVAQIDVVRRAAGLAAMVGAMAIGFSEFPGHQRLVAMAAIFIHLIGIATVAAFDAQQRHIEALCRESELTFRFWLEDLARKMVSGEATRPNFDANWIWLAAKEDARELLLETVEEHRRPSVIFRLAGLIGLYGIAVLSALALARIF